MKDTRISMWRHCHQTNVRNIYRYQGMLIWSIEMVKFYPNPFVHYTYGRNQDVHRHCGYLYEDTHHNEQDEEEESYFQICYLQGYKEDSIMDVYILLLRDHHST